MVDGKEEDNRNEFVDEAEEMSEEVELEEEEERLEDKLKKLRIRLKKAEQEKGDALEALQRTKADFLNSKKRLEEQLLRDKEHIISSHIESLLPLADSFDIAMSDPSWEECDEKWQKGVTGINAQLQSILRANGVEEIGGVGATFDPNIHEAVSSTPTKDAKDDHRIQDVIQKGYRMGEKVVRPAKVIVGISE